MDIQDLVRGVRNKLPEAQEELYKIRDKKAVPILVAALKDSDSVVRYTVTKVLGFIKDERAIEPLIDRMLHDNDDDVRAKAVESLGMIGSKRATESMLITMKSSTLRIRQAIAGAIGNLKDPRAIPALEEIINTEKYNYSLFHNAIYSLGQINTPDARDILLKVLQSPDVEKSQKEYAKEMIGSGRGIFSSLIKIFSR